MKDERYWPVLGTWLKDTAAAPGDPEQTARKVAERLPQTPQVRRRWWLPSLRRTSTPPRRNDQTTDHPPTISGRTRLMFSPVKAITAGAIVFAIGGAFLIAQPLGQQGSSVPGAGIEEGFGEAIRFEGVMRHGTDSVIGVLEALPNGVITNRGQVWTLTDVEMSDPRLEGTVSNMWNWDQHMSGDQSNLWVGGFRVVNDDGAWQMRPTVSFIAPDGAWTVWTGIFDGEGDYEGLTAIAEVTEDVYGFTLQGIIIDGEIPPAPEFMSTD